VVFGELLETSASPEGFVRALRERFSLYKSAGWNGSGGGVLFTAYCTPILEGSRARTERFTHALYGLPPDLEKGEGGAILGRRGTDGKLAAYPTRRQIEAGALLEGQGLELIWLADPLDAFIAHVNGSAFVRLPDGALARFGYAGNNGREYTSLARSLVDAGLLEGDDSNLSAIRRWAREFPSELLAFLHRNDRYVFFAPIDGTPRGSLNVSVTPERTLATDKSLFPRGSLVFVETHLTGARYTDGKEFHQFMLDQDTGGAIRTAGRADIYLGVGGAAEELAGSTRVEGQLYYLFLKP
jgi:membrane-bound lytic murein transglycosylase A